MVYYRTVGGEIAMLHQIHRNTNEPGFKSFSLKIFCHTREDAEFLAQCLGYHIRLVPIGAAIKFELESQEKSNPTPPPVHSPMR